MLNESLPFLSLLVLLLHIYLPFVLVPTHTAPSALTTHTLVPTHTPGLTCTLAYVPSTCIPIAQARIFYGSWPQVSLSNCLLLPPLPSPSFPSPPPCLLSAIYPPQHSHVHSCSQTSPHLLTLAFLPFHTHICFCSHFPRLKHARILIHARSLAHTQTCALATQLQRGSQNWYTYTQTTPVHASVPQPVQPLPVRSTQHTALQQYCCWQTPRPGPQ